MGGGHGENGMEEIRAFWMEGERENFVTPEVGAKDESFGGGGAKVVDEVQLNKVPIQCGGSIDVG